MNLRDLLDTDIDLASLQALFRQGLGWWLEELGALLPAPWRARLSSRPRLWLEPLPTSGWRAWKDGRPLDSAQGLALASAGAGARVGLVAPPGSVLFRVTSVPRLPAADTRRLVALDIDRLSPLASELIHFDVAIIPREGDEAQQTAQQTVRLAILPRAEARRLVALARAAGFEPAALATRSENETGPSRIDFLPQVRAADGEAAPSRVRLYGWIAAVALIIVNVAVLVGRDVVDVSRLSQLVEGQRPAVDTVLRLRRRVEAEESRRIALLNRGRRTDPLRMLSVVTQALPRGAWTQRLEWNGQTLHIVGFQDGDIDMAAAIRGSGDFTNPRAATPQPGREAAAGHAFDITADARPAPRP